MAHINTIRLAPLLASFLLFATTSSPILAAPQAGAASSGYHLLKVDQIRATSADGKAGGIGQVKWFYGSFPRGYIHRGDYTDNAMVIALHPVGCIWARVSYGYPLGSLSIGPGAPSGTISGGEYDNGMYVSCRSGRGYNRDYPRPLSLAGIGYAKAFLNSTTLEVCTSASKADGPRYCSWQKMVY